MSIPYRTHVHGKTQIYKAHPTKEVRTKNLIASNQLHGQLLPKIPGKDLKAILLLMGERVNWDANNADTHVSVEPLTNVQFLHRYNDPES